MTARSAERQTRGCGEDVTQSLFEQLCLGATTLRLDGGGADAALRGWFVLAARRRAVDVARAEERRRARERRAADPGAEPYALDVVEQLLSSESAGAVRRAVEALGADKRRAVTLAFFEGLSHRQVAETLDIPLGTAKTRIRSALAELAVTLAGLSRIEPAVG